MSDEVNFISRKGDVMQRQIRVLGVSCVVVVLGCAVEIAHAQQLSIRESFAGGEDLVVVAAKPAVAKEVKLTDEQTEFTKKAAYRTAPRAAGALSGLR